MENLLRLKRCAPSRRTVYKEKIGGGGGGGVDFERRIKVWYQISQFTTTGCTV
jgi:hypothetical protein